MLKTTLEIPDVLYRRLKAAAATQGKSVKAIVNEAIAEKLRHPGAAGTPGWMQGFGQLRHLHEETRKIEKVITEEFSRIDPEDWK
jgi:predicted transcriptional regulator